MSPHEMSGLIFWKCCRDKGQLVLDSTRSGQRPQPALLYVHLNSRPLFSTSLCVCVCVWKDLRLLLSSIKHSRSMTAIQMRQRHIQQDPSQPIEGSFSCIRQSVWRASPKHRWWALQCNRTCTFGSHSFTWIHEDKGQPTLFSPLVWAPVNISESVKINPFISF